MKRKTKVQSKEQMMPQTIAEQMNEVDNYAEMKKNNITPFFVGILPSKICNQAFGLFVNQDGNSFFGLA